MLTIILTGLLLAVVGPAIHRLREGLVVALFIAFTGGTFAWLVSQVGAVSAGRDVDAALSWVPSLDVALSFHLDGLSLLFSLLTSGIGFLVLLYSIAYLHDDPNRDRFYGYIFLFMISMLGLVLAGDVITLFIFWELTTLTSYLLIGFEHEHIISRRWALQALLVTGAGGLALLVGLLLLGMVGGSLELTELIRTGAVIRGHELYLPILILIALGAATKSAQVPFHFWLPSAMIAPTPVSAFLHSAAMVKAGVYLLARLLPILGGTASWVAVIGGFGLLSMVVAGLVAIFQQDIKRLLAYSTIAVLGILFLLLGLGTESAIKAVMVYMLVHALYKGALFMCAGAVGKVAGSKDIPDLGGLRRVMPWTAGITLLAAMSMAGLPPMVGYIGKEFLSKAQLHAPIAQEWLPGVAVVVNGLTVTAALILVVDVFWGRPGPGAEKARRAPFLLLFGPAVLAVASLVLGLFPDLFDDALIKPAAIATRAAPMHVEIKLWHGFNPVFFMGVAALLLGGGGYLFRRKCPWQRWLERLPPMGMERIYHVGLQSLEKAAGWFTFLLQNGNLRFYLLTVVTATVVLAALALWTFGQFPERQLPSGILVHEAMAAALVVTAAAAAVVARSMLTVVLALGSVGYGIAFIYLLFGAPDLAMTQFGVETLSVLLFVLVLYRFPLYPLKTTLPGRLRDGLLALACGTIVSLCLWVVTATAPGSRISKFFLENSVEMGKGHNVVNVILVDFRSLDTLVETTVLAIAALGAFLLLRSGRKGGDS